jgi:hypothetical protein
MELTKRDKPFIWDGHCEAAFQAVKQALIGPEIMGFPINEGGEFLLDFDASGVGIVAVLQQVQDKRERVIAYASRALDQAERNYCMNEKELLAVIYFVQYFRQYLLVMRFAVRTNQQVLIWLFSLKEPNGKIAKWLDFGTL